MQTNVMQENHVAAPSFISDMTDAYQAVKDLASRLQRAFEKVEDDAILNGKAIPLVRLLHGALRTQIQLAEKIQRRRKAVDVEQESIDRNAITRAKTDLKNEQDKSSRFDPASFSLRLESIQQRFQSALSRADIRKRAPSR